MTEYATGDIWNQSGGVQPTSMASDGEAGAGGREAPCGHSSSYSQALYDRQNSLLISPGLLSKEWFLNDKENVLE